MLRIIFFSIFLFSSSVFAKQTVYVYAASSMTEVVQQAKVHFQNSGIEVKGVFANSASLARQIAHKAPADIYISANSIWMEYVKNRLDLKQQADILAANRLVLIVPKSSQAKALNLTKLSDWQFLLGKGRLAIGEPQTVPVGIYSKEALESLNLYSSLQTQLAPMKNSRTTLAMVERRQVPVGIVYKTDAAQSRRVKVLQALPSELYQSITYPIIQLSQDAQVTEVYNYLLSAEMNSIILQLGFLPVE